MTLHIAAAGFDTFAREYARQKADGALDSFALSFARSKVTGSDDERANESALVYQREVNNGKSDMYAHMYSQLLGLNENNRREWAKTFDFCYNKTLKDGFYAERNRTHWDRLEDINRLAEDTSRLDGWSVSEDSEEITIGNDLTFSYRDLDPHFVYYYCFPISRNRLNSSRDGEYWKPAFVRAAYLVHGMQNGRSYTVARQYAFERNAGKSPEYATKFTDIFGAALDKGQEYRYAWAKAHAMTEWSKPEGYGDVFATHYVEGRENKELNREDAIEYAKQQADSAQ